MEELADYLYEVENGKSVDHVIGKETEIYMKELASVIRIDNKEWRKYVITLMFFAFMIAGDGIKDEVAFS